MQSDILGAGAIRARAGDINLYLCAGNLWTGDIVEA